MVEYKGGLLKLTSRAINSSISSTNFNVNDIVNIDNNIIIGEKCLNHLGYMFISITKHVFKHAKANEDETYHLIKKWTNEFNKKAVLNEFNLNSYNKKMQILYNEFCNIVSYTDTNKLNHLFECHEFFNKLLGFICKFNLDYKDLMHNVLKNRRNHEN